MTPNERIFAERPVREQDSPGAVAAKIHAASVLQKHRYALLRRTMHPSATAIAAVTQTTRTIGASGNLP
jgi:hypothetical protein